MADTVIETYNEDGEWKNRPEGNERAAPTKPKRKLLNTAVTSLKSARATTSSRIWTALFLSVILTRNSSEQ